MADLNSKQLAAVQHLQGPLLILAGAGTGKTRVITLRILKMIQCGISQDQIVALTFTNKAAREMKERVQAELGSAKLRVHISTFHSFCLNLMRQKPKDYGLGSKFTLVSSGDQIDMLRKIIEEHRWSSLLDPQQALGLVSRVKNAMLPRALQDQLGAQYQSHFDSHSHELVQAYNLLLRHNQAIDFDDCILRVSQSLEQNPDLLHSLQQRFRYLMIDEFQDTNFLQLGLVYQLGSEHRNVCVVGDDDQSIYSWRGAVSHNIALFEQLMDPVTVVKLEQNYRCSDKILDAANAVIKNNGSRMEKSLWCQKPSEVPIGLSIYSDEQTEGQKIAQKIMSLKGRGVGYQDMAILYRSNALSKSFEVALRSSRVPYRVYGGQSMFEKKEVRDVLAALRLINSDRDLLAFWRILNVPQRGIGLKSLELIAQLAQDLRVTPLMVLKDHTTQLPKSIQGSAQQFASMIEDLRSLPTSTPEQLEALTKECIRRFDFAREIRSRSKDPAKMQNKLLLLASLSEWIRNASEIIYESEGAVNLQRALQDLTLDDSAKKDKEKDFHHVSLMTMHSAKGLEFNYVFLVGLEEDLIPHKQSVLEGKTDEERRLFYVAITRAKEMLNLSYAKTRGIAAQTLPRNPSKFLKEIPKELLLNSEELYSDMSKEDRKKETLSRLSDLRASLAVGFSR